MGAVAAEDAPSGEALALPSRRSVRFSIDDDGGRYCDGSSVPCVGTCTLQASTFLPPE